MFYTPIKRLIKLASLLLPLAASHSLCQAQDWNLIWSDEFDQATLDLNTWNIEVNNLGGYNNELQYYTDRPQNIWLEDGKLIIEGKKENYIDREYTSARINSKGKKFFTYGKMEARMKLPYGDGMWPAFWMMGEQGQWPACGEIDILEMVGGDECYDCGDNKIHGYMWFTNTNGQNQSYGTAAPALASGKYADAYHNFAVVWNETSITWMIDDVPFYSHNITASEFSEFHQPFYFLLNLAIGGDWPNSPTEDTVWPQRLYVDYVRVYEATSNPTPENPDTNPLYTQNIEAESFSQSSGVSVENTSDNDNTQQVTGLTSNNWLAYSNISIPEAGTYKVQYRVSANTEGSLVLDQNAGATVLGTVEIPNTSNGWTTVSHLVNFPDTNFDLGLYVESGTFNLNWIKITRDNILLEAENYSQMLGVQTESCNEGGENVGYIDNQDWMSYENITVPESGNYNIEFRVASPQSGGKLSADLNAGTTFLGSVDIPNTGGWQNWTTVSLPVYMTAGTHSFGVFAEIGGWNINWIKISKAEANITAKENVVLQLKDEVTLYPNPASNVLHINNNTEQTFYSIINFAGKQIIKTTLVDGNEINISGLKPGIYLIQISNGNHNSVHRIIKN